MGRGQALAASPPIRSKFCFELSSGQYALRHLLLCQVCVVVCVSVVGARSLLCIFFTDAAFPPFKSLELHYTLSSTWSRKASLLLIPPSRAFLHPGADTERAL